MIQYPSHWLLIVKNKIVCTAIFLAENVDFGQKPVHVVPVCCFWSTRCLLSFWSHAALTNHNVHTGKRTGMFTFHLVSFSAYWAHSFPVNTWFFFTTPDFHHLETLLFQEWGRFNACWKFWIWSRVIWETPAADPEGYGLPDYESWWQVWSWTELWTWVHQWKVHALSSLVICSFFNQIRAS